MRARPGGRRAGIQRPVPQEVQHPAGVRHVHPSELLPSPIPRSAVLPAVRRRSAGPRVLSAAAAAAVLLSTTGCLAGPAGQSVAMPSGPTPSVSTGPTAPAGPEASGQAPSGQAPGPDSSAASPLAALDERALRAVFEDTAKELLVPGAVMLLRTPQRDLTFTYGVTSLGGSTPVSPDGHVRIGSITKTWTGTVILQLVQEGKLRLDRQGGAVPARRAQRRGHHHRTAAEHAQRALQLLGVVRAEPGPGHDPAKGLDAGGAAGHRLCPAPVFRPGRGVPLLEHEHRPAGPDRRTARGQAAGADHRGSDPGRRWACPSPPSRRRTPRTLPSPHPQGYMYMDNLLTLSSARLPADLLAKAQAGTLLPNDVTNANPSWTWAAGQGVSTAADLATWAEALAGGRLLDAQMQRMRLDSVRPVDPADPNGAAVRAGPGEVREPLRAHRRTARLQLLRRPRPGQQGHPGGVDQPCARGRRARPGRHHRPERAWCPGCPDRGAGSVACCAGPAG